MSTTAWPADDDDLPGEDDQPAEVIGRRWLTEFVHIMLNAYLEANRTAAVEGLHRCLDGLQAQHTRYSAWLGEQSSQLLAAAAAEVKKYPEKYAPVKLKGRKKSIPVSPAEVLLRMPFVAVADPIAPAVEWPFPLPWNRNLSADERWAVLVAAHDVVRHTSERIGPSGSLVYVSLLSFAGGCLARQDQRTLLEALLDGT